MDYGPITLHTFELRLHLERPQTECRKRSRRRKNSIAHAVLAGCICGVYKFSDIRILDQTLVTIYNYFSIHNYNITVL